MYFLNYFQQIERTFEKFLTRSNATLTEYIITEMMSWTTFLMKMNLMITTIITT